MEPGASEVPCELEKPLTIRGRRDADRNLSREARELAAKKSRYCFKNPLPNFDMYP